MMYQHHLMKCKAESSEVMWRNITWWNVCSTCWGRWQTSDHVTSSTNQITLPHQPIRSRYLINQSDHSHTLLLYFADVIESVFRSDPVMMSQWLSLSDPVTDSTPEHRPGLLPWRPALRPWLWPCRGRETFSHYSPSLLLSWHLHMTSPLLSPPPSSPPPQFLFPPVCLLSKASSSSSSSRLSLKIYL